MTETRGFRLRFSCAHLYHQPSWDEAQNQRTFGKCFSDHGHGHDYELWIETPLAGASFEKLREAGAELREHLDHKHLNFTIPEFKTQVPTTENLALYCREFLTKKMGEPVSLKLTLFECPWLGATL